MTAILFIPRLKVAAEVCSDHGLFFSVASDRAIVDDLWANVLGPHVGEQVRRGLLRRSSRPLARCDNMTIEVGSMLMAGRRCALLKDTSIAALPTDLVGKIYKPVDIGHAESVRRELHKWCREDRP